MKLEQLKNFFNKEDGNEKKKIENMVFFLILLVITIIAINFIWNGSKNEEKQDSNTTQFVTIESTSTENKENITENNLQNNLKSILGKIKGAGQVEVLITYTHTSELVPLYNETVKESITEETDSTGGVRTIEQKDNNKEVVYTEEGGEKQPITQKIIMPQVEGAVILAEGASNAEVKNNIIQAVEAVTGVSIHKIQVFGLEAEN